MKKAGNALIDDRRRPRGPPDQHPRRRLLPRADRRRAADARRCPLERAREIALATVAWTATLEFPEVERRRRARRAVRAAAPTRSTWAGSSPTAGIDIPPAEFDEHFVEEHVEHSNALHARVRERGSYLTGPLARCNARLDQPAAARPRGGARRPGWSEALPQPVPEHHRARRRARAGVRRGARAHRVLRAARRARRSRSCPGARHRARRQRGAARDALPPLRDRRRRHDPRAREIVPPTSQNQLAIEEDLRDGRRAATSSSPTSALALPLRAGDPQPRPVHLLRDALPDAHR